MKFLSFENIYFGLIALVVNTIYPFLFPIQEFLVFTFFVVICDTITGVFAAHKRGEKIVSSGLRRTIVKILIYFIAILLAEGIRVVFIKEIGVPYAISFIIAITEFKSNVENIESISGHKIWAQLKSKINLK